MKFLATFVLTILLGYAAYLFANETPWWIFAIGALIAGWIVPLSSFKTWLAGFLGVFLLWLVLCYITDNANAGIMSQKMANIIPLQGSSNALIAIAAFIGGMVAGFAALTGSFIRKRISK
jgi:hypothetical protein